MNFKQYHLCGKLTIIKISGYILHLEPKLRMYGDIPFLLQMPSWCGQRNFYIGCSTFENGQISTCCTHYYETSAGRMRNSGQPLKRPGMLY
jgi:hypothetical protein